MKLFGTDGIRAEVNTSPMTPDIVLRVGMAAARVLQTGHGRNKVLIGKDTRISGYMIESALTSGLCSMGMDVTLVGPIPTPGIAFLTRALRLDAGIVISASHNPFYDNGIKFFSRDGFKLPDEMEQEIERLVMSEHALHRGRPRGAEIGKAHRLEDASGRYIEYIKSTFPKGMTLEGLRVVVDCANGAAYKITPNVLRELGAEVIAINDEPDGVNINHECGSTHMQGLMKAVRKHKAHVGVAHDGDADRTLLCDAQGRFIDGDRIMGMWALEMKEEGTLRGGSVVSTVMSNIGLEKFLTSHGIGMIRTDVGDRFVTERMIAEGCNLGGEQSGHILLLDYNTTGDGPITALHVLYLMKKHGRSLSELAGAIEIFPQILVNVQVQKKTGWAKDPQIKKSIEDVQEKLSGRGRVLVRASGTEPKIRVMIEGDNQQEIETLANEIADVIKARTSE